MITKESGKKQWWYSFSPNDQGLLNPELLPTKEGWPRPYQCLLDVKDKYEGYELSKGNSQENNKILKNIQLISEKKIAKLWDYESSDLYEIFSSRFCQMLQQIGVSNIEYFPVSVTCKTTKASSSSYYQLAVIVGRTDGIYFLSKKTHEKKYKDHPISYMRKGNAISDHVRADKTIMDKLKHKIIRCEVLPELFVVDNDIKEAIEVNELTGFMFKKIPFFDPNEFK